MLRVRVIVRLLRSLLTFSVLFTIRAITLGPMGPRRLWHDGLQQPRIPVTSRRSVRWTSRFAQRLRR